MAAWRGCPRNALTGLHIPDSTNPNFCMKCGARRDQKAELLRRNDDPVTSHIAAREVVSSGRGESLRRVAIDYISAHEGCVAGEVEEGTGVTGIWKRISDLKRDGYIKYGTPRPFRGRPQHTLWLVE